ncbi:uncharacterized protein (DUF2235 family) [Phyllobacterium trifolii]|uniref:Uncharacterized protein (DUF2235 family) n=1 Tax=Phyllobacterium trifolii TaxID=300193 RepID=A0A839UC07_9HYPH|nr:DUF2235 domain-containing protein [Phyllobacterium trifolii]MBB3148576.1 uncharacterized protein (DUF2235 family) [Phyllobacterium trifolii]
MGKNIVVFSDGTGQEGGVRAEQRMSNVYKLYRSCRVSPENAINPAEQVSFYDPGLGTETSATGMTGLVRWTQKLLASVSGKGITQNIADCYEFIINHYQPGDRIFLFGFSRGAYTARSVANLLMLCGVPTRVEEQVLPRFRKTVRDIAEEAVHSVLEHGAGHPRATYEEERLEMARRFRARYGSDHETGEKHRSNAAPYFIGVFDTVAALGAKGFRRIAIQSGLAIGALVLGAAVAIVPSIVLGAIISALSTLSFWTMFWAGVILGALAALYFLRRTQRNETTKTIRDFPEKGDVRSHVAEWKAEHFDRLLSRFVCYARAANAIDETRQDFDRVGWGNTVGAAVAIEGHQRLKQPWFVGNHSDIGGSYPEVESRLSDIALVWMIEEATAVPNGLEVGPITTNGQPMPRTLDAGSALHLFPASNGVQHCEVAGMRDLLETRVPKWLRSWTAGLGWKVKPRMIKPEAILHPTVLERFAMGEVQQCAGYGPYRPEALRRHEQVKQYFPDVQ